MECIVYSGRPPGPGRYYGTNITKIQCRNCFLHRKSGGYVEKESAIRQGAIKMKLGSLPINQQ